MKEQREGGRGKEGGRESPASLSQGSPPLPGCPLLLRLITNFPLADLLSFCGYVDHQLLGTHSKCTLVQNDTQARLNVDTTVYVQFTFLSVSLRYCLSCAYVLCIHVPTVPYTM